MSTLVIAFGLAAIAVTAYASWLALAQHRLRQRLDALETQAEQEAPRQPRARAA